MKIPCRILNHPPIMESQMEKNMENKMDTREYIEPPKTLVSLLPPIKVLT